MRYINISRKKRASTREVRSILEESLAVTFNGSSDIRDCIISVAFVCTYITAADLSYYLGMPENSFKSLHRQLNDLVEANLLKTINFDAKDGQSRTCYYLTESGFSYGCSLMSHPITLSYKRRGKSVTTLHDYSSGLNALQLILSKNLFSWSREVIYSNSSSVKKYGGSLCIDAIADFKDNKRLYFEEDLGTESIQTLMNKLIKYEHYGLFNEPVNTALIFSFRKPFVVADSPTYPAFSAKYVEKLIGYMKSCRLTLNGALTRLSEEGNEELVGVANNIKELYDLNNTGLDINIEGLMNYLADLKELKLDKRVEVMNRLQGAFSIQRMEGMANMLIPALYSQGLEHIPYLDAILKGYRVYCLPTPLISNYLSVIDLMGGDLRPKVLETLKMSFSGLILDSYKAIGKANGCYLRNQFDFNRGSVYVEDISKDLGGMLRVLNYIHHIKEQSEESKPTYLVCITDSGLCGAGSRIMYELESISSSFPEKKIYFMSYDELLYSKHIKLT